MKLSETISRKFVEQFNISEWEVESDTGYSDIISTNKTIEYEIYSILTRSGIKLECADTHILIDYCGNEIFAKDSLNQFIKTKFGNDQVISVLATGIYENMYDLSVDSEDHTYYTNNILSHNTITTAAYFLWCVLFNADENIAILANKAAMAREILSRIQFAYENLPFWLQQGVIEWNKGSIKLDNNSKIFASATSPNAIRGNSCSKVYIDEISFIPNNIAEDFLASVFPVISSGTKTKIFITSTPKGMNVFHKIWVDAEANRNGFIPVRITWQENPDRDETWLEEQKKNLGPIKFAQEVLTEFSGSSKTLIDGQKLATIPFKDPSFENNKLKIYVDPIKGNAYVCTVDTSRGQHLDYSAFVIIDITTTPYKVVATFKDNTIGLMSYPFMIYNTAKQYNDAYCLIEINDAGQEIANTIFYEFEYSNVYFSHHEKMTEGQGYPGVRTTKKVKSIGCSVLKELIESDQLELNSYDILKELAVYEQKGASYSASDTQINDDLTACLFLFAWLTKQTLFADITNINIRKILAQKNEDYIRENMSPFGFFDDGLEAFRITEAASNYTPQKIEGVMSVEDWINS